VIRLGGQAVVVVPVAGFLRLQALEQAASPEELEDAEDTAADDDPRPAGSFPYGPPDLRRLRAWDTGWRATGPLWSGHRG